MTAWNADLNTQIQALHTILNQSPPIREVLDTAPQLQMPDWYLGAGCLVQTVWNMLSGYEISAHINDLDAEPSIDE